MGKYTADQTADAFLAFCNEYGDLLSNLKLQKMLYYAQGWHLAQYDTPLFDDALEAWVHGPVVPGVYHRFKAFGYKPIEHPAALEDQPGGLVAHVRDVWEAYGSLTAYDLERLSHSETPWLLARGGRREDSPCQEVISVDEMMRFFKSKLPNG